MTDVILPDTSKRRVKDIMTANVIRIFPNTPVPKIARLMHTYSLSGVPVVDNEDRVLGVVTETDLIVRNTRFKMPLFFTILDSIIYLETPHHFQDRLQHMLGITASEIMAKPAVTIDPEATIEKLSEIMVNHRKNPIPVIDKDKKLVGIVSRADIIRIMVEEGGEDIDEDGEEEEKEKEKEG